MVDSPFKKCISPEINFSLKSEAIPLVIDYKYLGIYLYTKLNWFKQISDVHAKTALAKASLKFLLAKHNCL